MFISEGRKPFLQEAAVEIRMMGNDEDDPAEQIIDGAVVDAVIRRPSLPPIADTL